MSEREAPSLMEDIVEEILLRFPPDDPESLLRAALVSKSWCRLVCSPSFNRRFRKFHHPTSPPVLGFFYGSCKRFTRPDSVPGDTGFMPLTSSFRRLPHAFMPNWGAVDARHGRVLFYDVNDMATPDSVEHLHFIVWNPITGEASKLPVVRMNGPMSTWSAALICDDDCGVGSFRVALVAKVPGFTSACVYSSEQHAWNTPIYKPSTAAPILRGRHAVIGNALYFSCVRNQMWILEYDISKHEISFILAWEVLRCHWITLMASEDGGLRAAVVVNGKLYIFSWEKIARLNGDRRWVLARKFVLRTLIPPPFTYQASVVAAENDLSVVFIKTLGRIFVIDLKFGRVRKIYEIPDDRDMRGIVPYATFCTPGIRSSLLDESPKPGEST